MDLTGLSNLSRIKSQAFGNRQSLKTVRMGYVPNVSATECRDQVGFIIKYKGKE